ncbi:MAG: phospholipase D-like domain-containing protein [Candidatus Methanomethylophilaceae archaeon]|nr:phospholipase D-like domain-containing protein [Candidatus Methanomethylophilaceae archaeon]
MMRTLRLLSLMLPILLLLPSSSLLAVPMPTPTGLLLLDAVMPAYGVEMLSICNYGEAPVDIQGLRISDGEGTLQIEVNHVLWPGEKAHLRSDEIWMPLEGRQFIFPSTEVSMVGRFIMADAGDEVTLTMDDELLDAFVYGNGDTTIPGWEGPALPRIGKGKAAMRIPFQDQNSMMDWLASNLGRTHFPVSTHMALVEPFLFPEDAFFRIMRELSAVDWEVCISIYQLNNLSIASALAELAIAGKTVKILMEGSPVGGVSESVQSLLAALSEAGCDLRFIRSADGFKRYDYLHNKYAVIDRSRVIVTSENWQDSSLLNNRGWGVSIDSVGLAEQLWQVFETDFEDRSLDIMGFSTRFPYIDPLVLPNNTFSMPPVLNISVVSAEVSLLLCPDNAYEHLRLIMAQAERKIYVQQFYAQGSWLEQDSPLVWMIEAADRDVDVRLMLDSSWFSSSKDNEMVVLRMDEAPGVNAKLSPSESGFSIVHNKGAIIDDVVLVSSINWVDASFFQNREIGVMVRSDVLASFFTMAFLRDWGEIIEELTVRMDVPGDPPTDGKPFVVEASTSGRPVENLSWDLDSDGSPDLYGWRQVLVLPSGLHNITLTAMDDLGQTASLTVHLEVLPGVEDETTWSTWGFVPLLSLPVTMIVYRIWRRRRPGQE